VRTGTNNTNYKRKTVEVEYNEIKASIDDAQSSLVSAKSGYDKLRIYITLGNSYILLSDYENTRDNLMNALLAFGEAEKIVKTIEDKNSAEIETQKGYLFFKLSFFEDKEFNVNKSIEHYMAALEQLQNEKDFDKMLHVKYNLANSYIALSGDSHKEKLIKSIDILKEVEHGAFEINSAETLAMAKNAEGIAHLMLAKLVNGEKSVKTVNKALVAFNEAEIFYTKSAYPLNYASCENEIGATLLELGFQSVEPQQNLNDAIMHFQNALQIYTPNGSPFDYASACYNVGISYSKLAKTSEGNNKKDYLENSIIYFEKALEVFNLDGTPKEYARTNFELGTVRREKFLLDRDSAPLEKEIENFKGVLKVFNKKENPFTYLTAEFFIGESLYFLGRLDEALPYYNQAESIALEVDEKLAQDINEIKENILKTL
jgi:tetratricopeptide (TPR) repeat protein